MAEQRQSITARLTLTAWESWSAEPHWRNAVIIAVVGSIAFSLAKPPIKAPTTSANQPAAMQQPQNIQSGQSNNQVLPTVSLKPQSLKPKIQSDDVEIKPSVKDKNTDFAKSHGE